MSVLVLSLATSGIASGQCPKAGTRLLAHEAGFRVSVTGRDREKV